MALFKEWCPELEAALSEPFPAALIEQKKQGGASIDFVAWHHYTRRLNLLVGGNWNCHVVRVDNVGGKTMLTVAVTILGQTRENVGDEDSDHDAYGTASTNAYSQAYKRACALFGLGLSMYDRKGLAAKANGEDRRPDPIDALAQAARRDVREAAAAAGAPPKCPKCGKAMWDNRAQNDAKLPLPPGKKLPPDFVCRDKDNCDGKYWRGQWPPKPQEAPLDDFFGPDPDESSRYE